MCSICNIRSNWKAHKTVMDKGNGTRVPSKVKLLSTFVETCPRLGVQGTCTQNLNKEPFLSVREKTKEAGKYEI